MRVGVVVINVMAEEVPGVACRGLALPLEVLKIAVE
jgi:hypothetical protein